MDCSGRGTGSANDSGRDDGGQHAARGWRSFGLGRCWNAAQRRRQPIEWGTAMIRKLVLLLAALVFGSISLSACNTMQGAGRDVEKLGSKVNEEATEHKHY
jgi:predicted small secreted protein